MSSWGVSHPLTAASPAGLLDHEAPPLSKEALLVSPVIRNKSIEYLAMTNSLLLKYHLEFCIFTLHFNILGKPITALYGLNESIDLQNKFILIRAFNDEQQFSPLAQALVLEMTGRSSVSSPHPIASRGEQRELKRMIYAWPTS